MSEAIFPVLGSALVVLVVLPIAAIAARMLLEVLGRVSAVGGLHGLRTRHLLVLASSIVPIAWFVSAAVHQAESGRSVLACVLDHGLDAACHEPRLFSLALLASIALLALPTLVRAVRMPPTKPVSLGHEGSLRVLAIVERHPALSRLLGRVAVVEELAPAIATHGLLRPIVLVRASYLDALDDAAVAAALAHELEHVEQRDPLRYLLLSLALATNPIGRVWLRREVHRWIAAREAQCDRAAVVRGADPTALAHAVVLAARPGEHACPGAALAGSDMATLRLRIELLMAYAEDPPVGTQYSARRGLGLAVAVLFLVVAWPHSGETAALDILHVGAEAALAPLLSGG